MKRKLLLIVLLTTISLSSYCQIEFEKGYFINNSNKKTECFIKNSDWYSNPTEFKYKLTQEGNVESADINSVIEFGIGDVTRFIKATVKVDYSSNNVNEMSASKSPEFIEETVFLKVLVAGDASLFIYKNANLTRFFYKRNDTKINPLIYKQYIFKNGFAHNNTYRQQLFVDLKCKELRESNFKSLNYQENDLVPLFIKYNSCKNANFLVYKKPKQKKDVLNFSLRPGICMSNLTISNPSIRHQDTDFGNSTNLRFGAEFEIILPFNNSKWRLLIEPTYQYLKSTKNTISSDIDNPFSYEATINYQSLEMPLGLRHCFFLNDKFLLFANLSYVVDFPFNSNINFTRIFDEKDSGELNIDSSNNLAFGIGLKYNEKYSIELRYQAKRNILGQYGVWNSNLHSTSVILSYKLF